MINEDKNKIDIERILERLKRIEFKLSQKEGGKNEQKDETYSLTSGQ